MSNRNGLREFPRSGRNIAHAGAASVAGDRAGASRGAKPGVGCSTMVLPSGVPSNHLGASIPPDVSGQNFFCTEPSPVLASDLPWGGGW